MSPYEKMMGWFEASDEDKPFAWYLDWYSRNGFVYATPSFFIMGKAIKKDATAHQADCWFIAGMAGDMSHAWGIMPWPLPWIAFERSNGGEKRLAFYRASDLKRLCPPMNNLDAQVAHGR